ncbi:hypothetical protein PUN28_001991 [Cardiocondyla obscurior]|uniref:Ribosomal protein L15 n=1 Tax=Cardiocondyla obscurior TaxID=286306 RepID=A0AAW2GS63_9HYME
MCGIRAQVLVPRKHENGYQWIYLHKYFRARHRKILHSGYDRPQGPRGRYVWRSGAFICARNRRRLFKRSRGKLLK